MIVSISAFLIAATASSADSIPLNEFFRLSERKEIVWNSELGVKAENLKLFPGYESFHALYEQNPTYELRTFFRDKEGATALHSIEEVTNLFNDSKVDTFSLEGDELYLEKSKPNLSKAMNVGLQGTTSFIFGSIYIKSTFDLGKALYQRWSCRDKMKEFSEVPKKPIVFSAATIPLHLGTHVVLKRWAEGLNRGQAENQIAKLEDLEKTLDEKKNDPGILIQRLTLSEIQEDQRLHYQMLFFQKEFIALAHLYEEILKQNKIELELLNHAFEVTEYFTEPHEADLSVDRIDMELGTFEMPFSALGVVNYQRLRSELKSKRLSTDGKILQKEFERKLAIAYRYHLFRKHLGNFVELAEKTKSPSPASRGLG